MLKRLVTLLLFTMVSLFAAPNIAQIQAAVEANPSLLNTPQAKAAMAEKGVTAVEVKAKLESANSSAKNASVDTTATSAENDIDSETTTDKSTDTAHTLKKPSFRVNPFAYQSSASISRALRKKQQVLVKNKLVRYSSKFFTNKNVINSANVPTPDDTSSQMVILWLSMSMVTEIRHLHLL